MKKITLLLLTTLILVACNSTEKDQARAYLEAEAKATHMQLVGKKIDMSTTSDGCEFKDDKFYYYYTIDEDIVSIASLETNKQYIEDNMRAMLENMPATKPLIENIKTIDGKVVYHYKGSNTGKCLEIELEF